MILTFSHIFIVTGIFFFAKLSPSFSSAGLSLALMFISPPIHPTPTKKVERNGNCKNLSQIVALLPRNQSTAPVFREAKDSDPSPHPYLEFVFRLFCTIYCSVMLKYTISGIIWQVFPSHNIFLLPLVFFWFLDLCVRVLELHVSSWAPRYFYLRFGVTQIFNEIFFPGHFGGHNDPPNLEYAPKSTKLVNFRP